jgi:putative glycosyltransferase
MKLSIVTTLYESGPFIEEFYRRASQAAKKITDQYEIVMVDDGSPDESLKIALSLVKRDPRVRVVELSRNFGHHKALMTGIGYATGELVFLIDIDLEESPELLESFYNKLLQSDCDVVFGYQAQRKGGFIENNGGQLAWYFIGKLYSIKIPPNQCTVRLMRREYVDALLQYRESNTVIGGLWVITGFHQIGVPISKGRRPGASYTLARRIITLANGITSFSTAPLVFMVYMGMLFSFVSFMFGVFVVLQKLIYNSAVGWASLIASIWLMGGIIVFCLGVIGIYISRIFVETKNRPYVLVRRVHQSDFDER